MNFDACRVSSQKKLVVAEENGRRFVMENPSLRQVDEYRVDGCLITDDRERCDFMYEVDSPCTLAIYVELKGKEIEKAISQLSATIGYLKSRHKKVSKVCFIICSRVPKAGPKTQQLKEKFYSTHNTPLKIYCNQGKHLI